MRQSILVAISVYLGIVVPFFMAYAAPQPDRAPAQIIKNHDFEEGDSNRPGDWKNLADLGIAEADPGAAYAWDDLAAHSGKRSVRIKKSNDDKLAGWVQEILSLRPGQWYEISAWARTEGMVATPVPESGALIGLVFVIQGLERIIIYDAPVIKEAQDWRQQKLVFIVPEGCSEVRLVLGLKRMQGTVWWDDVRIKEVPNEELSAKKEDSRAGMDHYGGYKKIKGKATGFFHIEKTDSRWWIITPEGNGFIVSGIQHMLRPQEPTREWIQDSTEKLKKWGFNTLSHNSVFKPFVYTEAASPSLWGFPFINPEEKVKKIIVPLAGVDFKNIYATAVGFFDVFDKDFEAILEREFKEKAAILKDDPWLLGYFLGNELPWDGYPAGKVTLFDMFFALAGERPGKKAVVDFLKIRYGNNVGNFNRAWGASIDNFEELLTMYRLGAGVRSEQARGDISEFIRLTAKKYFETNYRIIKKFDSNHMILGVRFSQHARTPIEVLEESGKYVDIETFNAYDLIAPLESLEQTCRFHRKPVLITEFSCKARDSGLPNKVGAGIVFRTQHDRALWYERFVLRLVSSPHIVGFIWYKYEDDPPREVGEDGNYGLVTRDEKAYEELVETATRVNRRIYEYVLAHMSSATIFKGN